MNLCNNVFASLYCYYSKFKNEAPLGSSICLVLVSQISVTILIFVLIGRFMGNNLFSIFPNKYYGPFFFAIWLFILFKYYSKSRTDTIGKDFKLKSLLEKRNWGIVTLVLFIVPTSLILIF